MKQFSKFILILTSIILFNATLLADPWGTNLGNYNGVICYSNMPPVPNCSVYDCSSSSCDNCYNGTNTGLKWQCVEYVNRYYLIRSNHDIRIAGQNANLYYPNASARGLNSYPNGGTTSPALGDLLCFMGGTDGFGHVAIIREVGSNYLKVIQQNVTQNSNDANFTFNMTVSGGHYNVSGSTIGPTYVCQGWLREPAATVSVSFKFNGTELPAPPNEWKLWKYPPIPNNYYTLTVTLTGRPSGATWDLYLYRPNGDSIAAAQNVNLDVLTQPFNVDSTNAWFPNSGNYRLKVFERTVPLTLWSTSQPFYISALPHLTVGTMPGTIYVGQPATFSWSVTGGIPTLPQGGWIGNIQIQWYHYDTAKNVLGTPLVNSSPLTFTVPAVTGGPIPGTNYRLSGSNPAGTSIPPGYIFAFTNYFNIQYPTGLEPISVIAPGSYKLYENFPNPFNPITNINFDIVSKGSVKLIILDVLGQEVTTLVNEELLAGSYKINWDATEYPSGIYFYKLQAGDFIETKKMILIK